VFKHSGRVAETSRSEVPTMPSSHEPPIGGKIPIRPPLRLVHPAKPKEPRRGRKRPFHCDIFTADEQRLLRASLKTARGLFGTWPCLADALRMSLAGLAFAAQGRVPVSPALAVRLSRALGVPFEALLRPGLRVVRNPCPTCGRGES
jgi:hypothetical protein